MLLGIGQEGDFLFAFIQAGEALREAFSAGVIFDDLLAKFCLTELASVLLRIELLLFSGDFADCIDGRLQRSHRSCVIALCEFFAFGVERDERLHFFAQHLDLSLIFFVIGEYKRHDALAFIGELAREFLMLRQRVFTGIELLEPLYICLAGGFERGFVMNHRRGRHRAKGADGSLALGGLRTAQPRSRGADVLHVGCRCVLGAQRRSESDKEKQQGFHEKVLLHAGNRQAAGVFFHFGSRNFAA